MKNPLRINKLLKNPARINNLHLMVRILATRTSALYSFLAGVIGATSIEIVLLAVKMWAPNFYESFILNECWYFVILGVLLFGCLSLFFWKKRDAETPLIEYFKKNPELEDHKGGINNEQQH